MVIGEAVEKMRIEVEALLASGLARVAVDCSGLEYIDSSALGCLVMAHSRCEQAGGVMVLFALNQRNVELLIITKLATVFRITDAEQDAVNLCYPGRAVSSFDILNFVTDQRTARRAAHRAARGQGKPT